MVLAAAAPMAVVVATTPIIVVESGSIAIPLFFLLAMMILLLFTVGFTRMSEYVKNAGAFASYVQAGLGRTQGIGAATLAIFSYAGLLLATSSYIGVALSNVVTRYSNVEVTWWVFTALVLFVVGLLGYRDIELSSKVLTVVLFLEVGAVLLLNFAIFSQGGANGLDAKSVMPVELTTGHPGLGLMFAFFAFFGFEATAVFRSEAKDPERTIPRATYTAVIFIGLFYALSAVAVIVGVGASHAVEAATADPEKLVLDLATEYVGPVFFDIIQVLLVTSLFACILSFHNVVTRYTFTLGQRRVLKSRLGAVNSRHGAPSTASVAVSVCSAAAMLAIVLSGIDPVSESYTWLSGAATLGLVALMALTSVAVIMFFRAQTEVNPLWQTLIAPGLAAVGLGIVLVLVIANFMALISDPVSAWVVAALVVASYVVGIGLAIRLKRTQPQTYAELADG
jgi:amino acid transporter